MRLLILLVAFFCSVAKHAPPSDRSAAGESLAEIRMKMGVLYE